MNQIIMSNNHDNFYKINQFIMLKVINSFVFFDSINFELIWNK